MTIAFRCNEIKMQAVRGQM